MHWDHKPDSAELHRYGVYFLVALAAVFVGTGLATDAGYDRFWRGALAFEAASRDQLHWPAMADGASWWSVRGFAWAYLIAAGVVAAFGYTSLVRFTAETMSYRFMLVFLAGFLVFFAWVNGVPAAERILPPLR